MTTTDLDAKAARVAALSPEHRERIAYVENIAAIHRLPVMQGNDKTKMRRIVVMNNVRPSMLGPQVISRISINDDGRIQVGIPGGFAFINVDEPLPEWWTELVPA